MAVKLDEVKLILEHIDAGLTVHVTLYVLGGVVLVYQGLKDATKDIDIVLDSSREYHEFTKALESIGFALKKSTKPYQKLKLSGIYEKGDYRFDVFDKEICANMSLSDGMIKRAEPWLSFKKLKVYLLSLEDVFVFKSLTEREGDISDSAAIIQKGIDWKVVLDELHSQIAQHDKPVWITDFAERISVLEERYGITVPIQKEIDKAAEEFYDYLELMQALKTPKTFEELQNLTEIKSLKKILEKFIKQGKILEKKGKYALK